MSRKILFAVVTSAVILLAVPPQAKAATSDDLYAQAAQLSQAADTAEQNAQIVEDEYSGKAALIDKIRPDMSVQTTSKANAVAARCKADAVQHSADVAKAQEDAQAAEEEAQEATSSSPTTSSSTSNSSSSDSFTWVAASEYGDGDGCMGGTTASGATVTESSMGIAMRTIALGTKVELSYNGHTCYATVDDRGPYVGDRQIDLQPAVASALGFDGLGTVGYRVVP